LKQITEALHVTGEFRKIIVYQLQWLISNSSMGLSRFLSTFYRGFSPEAKRQELEADNSYENSANVIITWNVMTPSLIRLLVRR
jgi:hypothetical protein